MMYVGIEISPNWMCDGFKLTLVQCLTHVRLGSKADIRAAKSYVRFTPKSGHLQRTTSACLLRARSRHHCGSSSFGKLFMPLRTAVLTAVKSLLGEPGLGATTLTPTTRTAAITIRAMDSVWRMCSLFPL